MSYRLWCRNTGGNKQLSFRPPDSPHKVKLSSKSDAQTRSYYNLHAYVVIAAQYDFLLYCQSGICNVCFDLNCQYLYLAAADAAVVWLEITVEEQGRPLSRPRGSRASIAPDIHQMIAGSYFGCANLHISHDVFFFCNHIRVQTVKG